MTSARKANPSEDPVECVETHIVGFRTMGFGFLLN